MNKTDKNLTDTIPQYVTPTDDTSTDNTQKKKFWPVWTKWLLNSACCMAILYFGGILVYNLNIYTTEFINFPGVIQTFAAFIKNIFVISIMHYTVSNLLNQLKK